MDITICRKRGFFDSAHGRRVPLLVLFNGAVVGRVATGEVLALTLADVVGTLQVGLLDDRKPSRSGDVPEGVFSVSQGISISPSQQVQAFSVKTRSWVFFDVFDWVYFRPLGRWVFAVQKEAT